MPFWLDTNEKSRRDLPLKLPFCRSERRIMILWKDLAPQLDAEEANLMLSTLFEPEDILSLSVKSPEDGVLTQRFVAGAGIPQDNLESLCAHGDVYVGIATLKSAEYTPRKRVKKEDVKSVGVLYADLDVKPGSFETQEEALAFLSYLLGCVKFRRRENA